MKHYVGRSQSCIVLSISFTAATLFVGNLSFRVRDYDLIDFFSNEGFKPTSARVITQQGQQGSRSKGLVAKHACIVHTCTRIICDNMGGKGLTC